MEEIKEKRTENKYIIPQSIAQKIISDLEKIMNYDQHSQSGKYKIRSVYFDSINNQDYYDTINGIANRKKIRMRTYGLDNKKCKLEVKAKNNGTQTKTSVWIRQEDAQSIIKGDLNTLKKYFKKNPETIKIYSLMTLGCYRPKITIEYERIAFFSSKNTRITFDYNIRRSETNFNIYDKNINFSDSCQNDFIMEVKYNNKLEDVIINILSKYRITQTSFSKYGKNRKIYIC